MHTTLRLPALGRVVALVSAATLAVPLLAAGPTAAAADSTRLSPAKLERGADTRLLHTEGNVLVDGDRRIRFRGVRHLGVLGRHGAGYVVVTSDRHHENWRVVTVAASGDRRVVTGGPNSLPVLMLSADGARVTAVGYPGDHTRVRVYRTGDGDKIRDRRFDGFLDLEDYGKHRMVFSQWDGRRARTFWYAPGRNRVSRISTRAAYLVDLEANRMAFLVGDPFQGGCQKVVRLSDREQLWRSCRERALSFSPDGSRMVTTHLLSDGLGPREVRVRAARGRVLETYRAEVFGFLEWEGNRSLLLETVGTEFTAAVRCRDNGRCTRASRLHRHGNRPLEGTRWTFPR